MKNSEIVEGAAEAIRTHGWQKHTYGADWFGYCLLGAGIRTIYQQCLDTATWSYGRVEEVAKAIHPGLPPEHQLLSERIVPANGVDLGILIQEQDNVTNFNDRTETTQEDVLDVLDKAAKYWRDRGE